MNWQNLYQTEDFWRESFLFWLERWSAEWDKQRKTLKVAGLLR